MKHFSDFDAAFWRIHYFQELDDLSSNAQIARIRYNTCTFTPLSSQHSFHVFKLNDGISHIYPGVIFSCISCVEKDEERTLPGVVQNLDYSLNTESSKNISPKFEFSRKIKSVDEYFWQFINNNYDNFKNQKEVDYLFKLDCIKKFISQQIGIEKGECGIFYPFNKYNVLVSPKAETDMDLTYFIPEEFINKDCVLHLFFLNQGSIIPVKTEIEESALNSISSEQAFFETDDSKFDVLGKNACWINKNGPKSSKPLSRIKFIYSFIRDEDFSSLI